jgi:hypothetical protein
MEKFETIGVSSSYRSGRIQQQQIDLVLGFSLLGDYYSFNLISPINGYI